MTASEFLFPALRFNYVIRYKPVLCTKHEHFVIFSMLEFLLFRQRPPLIIYPPRKVGDSDFFPKGLYCAARMLISSSQKDYQIVHQCSQRSQRCDHISHGCPPQSVFGHFLLLSGCDAGSVEPYQRSSRSVKFHR
jgi:hypothetical protein